MFNGSKNLEPRFIECYMLNVECLMKKNNLITIYK